jgi:hypothetical protein
MSKFDSMTLCRRYTRTDINGGPWGGDGLSEAQIRAQNKQCGFDYDNPDYPIVKTHDVDSVYYLQGRGPIKVGEPRIANPIDPGNTPYSRSW